MDGDDHNFNLFIPTWFTVVVIFLCVFNLVLLLFVLQF